MIEHCSHMDDIKFNGVIDDIVREVSMHDSPVKTMAKRVNASSGEKAENLVFEKVCDSVTQT